MEISNKDSDEIKVAIYSEEKAARTLTRSNAMTNKQEWRREKAIEYSDKKATRMNKWRKKVTI